MNIRRYLPNEEPAIWNVVYKARVSNARDYHSEIIDRWAPHDKDIRVWAERLKEKNPFIAIIEDKIVGMAEIDGDGFIDYFYVHPDYQGRGIGKNLLSIVIAESEAYNLSQVYADVSVTAKPFFESQGFEVTKARKNIILGHAAPNFRMTREL